MLLGPVFVLSELSDLLSDVVQDIITILLWIQYYHRRMMMYLSNGAKVRLLLTDHHFCLAQSDGYFPRQSATGTDIGNNPDKAARNLQRSNGVELLEWKNRRVSVFHNGCRVL